MYSVQLWSCWQGTKTTGINHINYLRSRVLERLLSLKVVFLLIAYFVKILLFFPPECSVYAAAANGNESKLPLEGGTQVVYSTVQPSPRHIRWKARSNLPAKALMGAELDSLSLAPAKSVGLQWQEVTCGVIFSCWERQMHPDQYHCLASKTYCYLTWHF